MEFLWQVIAQNKWPWLLLLLSLSPSPCIANRPFCLQGLPTAVDKNPSYLPGIWGSCLLTSATPDTVLCELSSSHWLPPWEVVVPSSPLLRMPSSSPHWPKPSPSRPGRGAPPHQAPGAVSSRSGATWAQRPFAAQPLQCLANSSLSKALISFGWGSSNHGGKGPCPQGG